MADKKQTRHAIDNVTRLPGGSLRSGISWISGEGYAQIIECDSRADNYGRVVLHTNGRTEAEAISKLERKIRRAAMAALSDEWEFGK